MRREGRRAGSGHPSLHTGRALEDSPVHTAGSLLHTARARSHSREELQALAEEGGGHGGKEMPTRCVVCQVLIRGLSWHCGSCGHGGHLECMRAWFHVDDDTVRGSGAGAGCGLGSGVGSGGCFTAPVHSLCPTGCGCQCLYTRPLQVGGQPPEPPLDEDLVVDEEGIGTHASTDGRLDSAYTSPLANRSTSPQSKSRRAHRRSSSGGRVEEARAAAAAASGRPARHAGLFDLSKFVAQWS